MATDIAFVGELRGKRSGSAGRTIRLIRLFEVSTRLLFMRRLIFPCVLIRVVALLATFVLATLSSAWRGTVWSLTKRSRTLRQVCLGGLSKGLGWPCLFVRSSLSSHVNVVVTLCSKSRWSHSFCRRLGLRFSYLIAAASVLRRDPAACVTLGSPPQARIPSAEDPNRFRVSTYSRRPPRSCEPTRSRPSSCVSSGHRECDRRWLEPRGCTAD